jgi:hypothetical protein
VIDTAKGCKANRDLYCNAEGCSIDIFLSSISGAAGSFKVKSFRFASHAGKPALSITRAGNCDGPQQPPCTVILRFDGTEFVSAP